MADFCGFCNLTFLKKCLRVIFEFFYQQEYNKMNNMKKLAVIALAVVIGNYVTEFVKTKLNKA